MLIISLFYLVLSLLWLLQLLGWHSVVPLVVIYYQLYNGITFSSLALVLVCHQNVFNHCSHIHDPYLPPLTPVPAYCIFLHVPIPPLHPSHSTGKTGDRAILETLPRPHTTQHKLQTKVSGGILENLTCRNFTRFGEILVWSRVILDWQMMALDGRDQDTVRGRQECCRGEWMSVTG